MRRRAFLEALGAPAVLGALGVSAAGCAKRTTEEIVVAALPQYGMAPLYLALEEERFARAGLAVRVEPFTRPAEALPSLAGGKLDVTVMSLTPGFVNGVIRGVRARVVAARDRVVPDCRDAGLLIRRKSFPDGLDDLRVLAGKRLSSVGGETGLTAFVLDEILHHAGLTRDDIIFEEVRDAGRVPALIRGQIDGIVDMGDGERIPPEMSDEVAYVGILGRYAPGLQYRFITYGPRLIDRDPALGARFLGVYQGAVRDFVAGSTPRFLRDLAESNNLDYERLRASCRASMSPDGALDLPSVQRYLDWCVEKGFVERRVDAAELVDARFVEAARQYS